MAGTIAAVAPRITLITLGVADIARARAFYERLGYVASSHSNENVTFFDAGGVILGLFGRASLAADAKVSDTPPGFSGVSLARNLESEAVVDAAMAHAKRAGATITKPAEKTFWGGYAGYFADLDGHHWEIAHNPYWSLDANGQPQLPA